MCFSAKHVTFALLCPTVAIVLPPTHGKENLEHSKVCSARFNAPSGDTFQVIQLAGGHMVNSKIGVNS